VGATGAGEQKKNRRQEMKSKWNTNRKDGDTVKINDGTLTYYANFDREIYDLSEIADDFADSYDHNGEVGEVNCIAEDLSSGETRKFTCAE
jgi:hypothetical protein